MDVHANQLEMFGLSKEADLASHKMKSVHVKERCLRTSTCWVTEKKA